MGEYVADKSANLGSGRSFEFPHLTTVLSIITLYTLYIGTTAVIYNKYLP